MKNITKRYSECGSCRGKGKEELPHFRNKRSNREEGSEGVKEEGNERRRKGT